MSDFVTVATYTYSHDARLALTLLADAGHSPRLADEHLVDAMPFYSNAVGGVKLTVPAEHVDEAQALLAEIPPEAIRPFRAGWMAVTALMFGPLAFVVLPLLWIWNGVTNSRHGAAPEG